MEKAYREGRRTPLLPMMGKKHSQRTRAKIAESVRKAWEDPIHRTSVSTKIEDLWKDPEYRGKNHSRIGMPHTEETKDLISRRITEWHEREQPWDDPVFRDKTVEAILAGWHRRPTQPEEQLDELLQSNELPYRYVGDGQFILAGKCPDFVNCSGEKKVIELFGDYWHDDDEAEERTELFGTFGYDTLIVWEHELQDQRTLTAKLVEFNCRKEVK